MSEMQDIEQVILVDDQDNELGTMEKMQAHREGKLHRAVSVFIFNAKKELLLQKRANGKYHSPGLWTNTCCTHPRQGETVKQAAVRRLKEEMGLSCPLHKAFTFIYEEKMSNDLIEHEFDHVFAGIADGKPTPEASEVEDFRYITVDMLDKELRTNPEQFTEWFKICYDKYFFELFKG
ncbi:isopentenyl-diphosphate Delta-isomerase [Flavipsychrobacter stenotrophus]|nr:isopentenyl-diphosphate Delta-isomerase [Flavipsychrobacter stenotrophus]